MKKTAAGSTRSSYDFSDDSDGGINDGVNGSTSQLTPENSVIGIDTHTPRSGGDGGFTPGGTSSARGGGLPSSLRKGGQQRLPVTPG